MHCALAFISAAIWVLYKLGSGFNLENPVRDGVGNNGRYRFIAFFQLFMFLSMKILSSINYYINIVKIFSQQSWRLPGLLCFKACRLSRGICGIGFVFVVNAILTRARSSF